MIIGVKKIVVIKRVVRKVIVTVLGVKMENLQIPDQIKELIGDEPYYIDDIGKSESQLILFSDKVLKIQEVSDESVKEIQVLTWLEDKLSVPEVLVSQVEGSTHYLLMSKIGGIWRVMTFIWLIQKNWLKRWQQLCGNYGMLICLVLNR